MSDRISENDDQWESDHESVDERYWVKLEDVKTLEVLYKEGALRVTPGPGAAGTEGSSTDEGAKDKAGYEPNAEFLKKVSLLCVFIFNSSVHREWPELITGLDFSQGDITKLQVDAIVNAANKSLLGGGGVDGAIHAAAGPKLLAECKQLNGARTGESKITRGYDLPARHVIHTVGPVYNASQPEEKAELLKSCYKTSLEVAVENGLKHVAFPSVSTGIYGYPIVDATHIAIRTTREFLEGPDGDKLDRVIFVVWSNTDRETYEQLLPEYFPLAS
ncbi:Macrod2 protein [Coprinopsis cinerea okayama7|uniref:Macrod2 protein n=1 Tax=Coprinopsis cinerea (strain Okayama-7 / 130 / ATCC MYA-4618 / FGSC 9003) TaxID=240176 RepID=A8NTS0_COPC7|nr:Macrod2 protein [Coprinopsis cinerea okayama7\|eukprot:XP_001836289.2 Macrod2 protein [Coprinopsis cinerea okayama7\